MQHLLDDDTAAPDRPGAIRVALAAAVALAGAAAALALALDVAG